MKITLLETIENDPGVTYPAGTTIEVTRKAGEKLIKAGKAKPQGAPDPVKIDTITEKK